MGVYCGAAHRQLKRQLKLLVLKELPDLAGNGDGHKTPHKMVAGHVHNVRPETGREWRWGRERLQFDLSTGEKLHKSGLFSSKNSSDRIRFENTCICITVFNCYIKAPENKPANELIQDGKTPEASCWCLIPLSSWCPSNYIESFSRYHSHDNAYMYKHISCLEHDP